MTSKKSQIVARQLTSTPKPISREFNIKEVDTLSHLRVETLDVKLMKELRSMKYKVGPEGMDIWNRKDRYLVELNNTKILDQWIEVLKLKKIILYNLVLPQIVKLNNFKRVFYIEESIVYDNENSDLLVYSTIDTRSDFLSEAVSDVRLREGVVLVCH